VVPYTTPALGYVSFPSCLSTSLLILSFLGWPTHVMAYSSCKNESAWTTMAARRKTNQGAPSHEETTAIHASER